MNRTIVLTGLIVSMGVVIGRAAGYVRELLLAYHFGVSENADNVILILTMPDLINNILSVSVLSNAFFPILKKQEDISDIVEQTLSLNILFYFLFVIISPIFFSGWLLVCMNIAMASVFFNAISFSQATYLAFLQKFKLQSLSTFIFNVGIVSIVAIFPQDIYIAVGVIFASCLRMLYISYISKKSKLFFKLQLTKVFRYLKVSRRLWLAILVNGLVFINPIIDKLFLNYFPEGSISSYSYAEKIYLLPVATVIAIYPDIIYSYLMENIRKGIDSLKLISGSIIFTVFISFFFSLVFYFLNSETVSVVYFFSKLNLTAVEKISPILKNFSIAILLAGLNSLLIKLLFACGKEKFIFKVSLAGFFFNILGNTYIYFYAREAMNMAFTTSLTALFITVFMLYGVYSNIRFFYGINDNR